jgi:hypothetical protein
MAIGYRIVFCNSPQPQNGMCNKKGPAVSSGAFLNSIIYRLFDDRGNDAGAAHRSRWRDL